MISRKPEKDERTVAVEKSAYTFAFRVVLFAILVDVMYRSLFLGQDTWDLLGIIFLGSLVATIYQRWYRALACNWWKTALVAAGIAFVVAAAIVSLRLFV